MRPTPGSRPAAEARTAHGHRARVEDLRVWGPGRARADGQEQGENAAHTHQGSRAYSSILTPARERRRERGMGPDPEAEVILDEGVIVCEDWLAASVYSQWKPYSVTLAPPLSSKGQVRQGRKQPAARDSRPLLPGRGAPRGLWCYPGAVPKFPRYVPLP